MTCFVGRANRYGASDEPVCGREPARYDDCVRENEHQRERREKERLRTAAAQRKALEMVLRAEEVGPWPSLRCDRAVKGSVVMTMGAGWWFS